MECFNNYDFANYFQKYLQQRTFCAILSLKQFCAYVHCPTVQVAFPRQGVLFHQSLLKKYVFVFSLNTKILIVITNIWLHITVQSLIAMRTQNKDAQNVNRKLAILWTLSLFMRKFNGTVYQPIFHFNHKNQQADPQKINGCLLTDK